MFSNRPQSLSGVNNYESHQYLITCFIMEISLRFDKFKIYKDYVVYPEYDLSNRRNPDISIYIQDKDKTKSPIVIIEICRARAVKKDFEKVR